LGGKGYAASSYSRERRWALSTQANRLDGRNVNVQRQRSARQLDAQRDVGGERWVAPASRRLPCWQLCRRSSRVAALVRALVATFTGVSDAESGSPEQQAAANQKLAEAMAKLSPAAQGFVHLCWL
jgi:hypothetical protein